MKKVQSATIGLCIAFLAMLFITSCKKNNDTAPPAGDNRHAIEELARKFAAPIGSDCADLKKEYAALNEADLKTFFRAMYAIQAEKAKPVLTAQEFEKLFDKLNTDSKLEFKRPLNKLGRGEILSAFKNRPAIVTDVRPPVGDPPPGCGFYNYFIDCYKDMSLSPSAPFTVHRIVDYHLYDCNGLECIYYGRFNRLVPITAWGDQNINYVDASYDGTYTTTLHKKDMTFFFFGSINGINVHLRMGYVYEPIGTE